MATFAATVVAVLAGPAAARLAWWLCFDEDQPREEEMMPHTPGPWSWRRDCTEIVIESYYGADDIAGIHNASREDASTDEANACLIAAAPELLAALKGLQHKSMPDWWKYHRFCDHAAEPCPRCEAVQAAIAKAEGATDA